MIVWWLVVAAVIASCLLVMWAMLEADARRQRQRREDRKAYREFMQGRWDRRKREIGL